MKKNFALLLFCVVLSPLFSQNLTQFVNPFIGTDAHGHTYPGAVVPFGLVQLSPDTRKHGWDGCSGYHYTDSVVFGFSHTHLSGTGVSDYADIMLKPFSPHAIKRQQNFVSEHPFGSLFSKDREIASPGYYSVYLEPDNIQVELTATARCGVHRYTFSNPEAPAILIDLDYRDLVLDSYLKMTAPDEIEGYRYSKAWANDQRVYFVMKFSHPISEFVIMENNETTNKSESRGKHIKAIAGFGKEHRQIIVKVGISGVDIAGARKNLEHEVPDFDFDRIKLQAIELWEKELAKIQITESDIDKKTVFYTSLYHCMIVPNIFSDVDGRYMGRDFKIHQTNNFDYYTVFSLWDTYRAYHPLMTIIDKKRTSDFVNTMLMQYKQGGLLPVWEFASNETWCMIGYHAVPVIADAIVKRIEGFDYNLALEAMIKSSMQDHFGLKYYRKYGYIPADFESESVSKTLEYAYDDWCIANTARLLGKNDIYKEYIHRAQFYKNNFDPETGFFRPKHNGNWMRPFNPREVTFHFTEANAWQYSMYIPHDVEGFKELLGGDPALCRMLDSLFHTSSKTTGRHQVDITGLIGQYAHGNEPSHHMAYLYAWCGQHYKTQQMVDRILNEMYTNTPDGLCGNEDCGQMSAWYVLSAAGFYPVNPADGFFVFGSPQFEKLVFHLENGNEFTIKTKNKSKDAVYIKEVFLNGKPYPYTYIHYEKIMEGGELLFIMSNTPNTDYGLSMEYRPQSSISEYQITEVPFFYSEGRTFKNQSTVSIHAVKPHHTIYYTTDGSEPGLHSQTYTSPFILDKTTTIKAVSHDEKLGLSFVAECTVHCIPEGRTIQIINKYSQQYTAGGDEGLIDYLRGPADFKTGYWQGYQNKNFEAIVNLGKTEMISKLALGCLQDIRSWIWMPVYVEFWVSKNGKKWDYIGRVEHGVEDSDYSAQVMDFEISFNPRKAKYVKVFAKNYGTIPDWHLGAGYQGYIFTDEIIIE